VMDGLEAATRIIGFNANIPIIAMTANIMANDREIYKMSGMNDCIGKPFTSQELWRCLLKYLKPGDEDASQKDLQSKVDKKLEEDKEFQKNLEKYFIRNNQKKFEEIAKAHEAGDLILVHRLAHTLKGNAGQINASRLQEAAANVERQLNGGKCRVSEEQLKLLETELNLVLTELSPLLDEPADKKAASISGAVFESEEIHKLFAKLEPLLKSGNPESVNFVNDLRAITEHNDLTQKLIQQIDDFEFEQALSTLAELIKRMVKND